MIIPQKELCMQPNAVIIMEQHQLNFNKSQLQHWEAIGCTVLAVFVPKQKLMAATFSAEYKVITVFLEMLPFGGGDWRPY